MILKHNILQVVGVSKMIEEERQGIIYFLGLILSILIGVFVWQSEAYTKYQGLIAFGSLLFGTLIVNTSIFRKRLYLGSALLVGIASWITLVVGSFYTFDLIFTIILTIIIVIVIATIALTVKE